MTTREQLNKVRRRSFGIAIPGFALGAVAMVSGTQPFLMIGGLSGFAMFMIGTLLMLFAGRCEKCKNRLGRVFSQAGGSLSIPAELRFCPYCGTSLDEP